MFNYGVGVSILLALFAVCALIVWFMMTKAIDQKIKHQQQCDRDQCIDEHENFLVL